MSLLSPSELALGETGSLTFCFDFESESQKEGNHVGVVGNSRWEAAARGANATLSLDESVYFNEQTCNTRVCANIWRNENLE